MHLLADHYRSEFLAVPQLVRFDFALGQAGHEPTLLIKASDLVLKYLLMGVGMELILARLDGGQLLYALKILDDPNKPATLWSIMERDDEMLALAALAEGQKCQVFLFNEIAVNVSWAEVETDFSWPDLRSFLATTVKASVDHSVLTDAVSVKLDYIHLNGPTDASMIVIKLPAAVWHPIRSTLITTQAFASTLDLFDKNEGGQQEELILWLTDNLHPTGAVRSPQIPKGNGTRELTDILLSHEYGTILFESKALSILTRATLPHRAKFDGGRGRPRR